MKKSFFLTLLFAFFSSFMLNSQNLYANTLNILVNQITVNQNFENQDKESENVLLFMDSLMDYMFSTGIIVSSEKVSLAKNLSNDEKIAMKACREGYFDYLAIIKVNVDAETGELLNASWNIKEVSSNSEKSKGYLVSTKNATDFGNEVAKNICTKTKFKNASF